MEQATNWMDRRQHWAALGAQGGDPQVAPLSYTQVSEWLARSLVWRRQDHRIDGVDHAVGGCNIRHRYISAVDLDRITADLKVDCFPLLGGGLHPVCQIGRCDATGQHM